MALKLFTCDYLLMIAIFLSVLYNIGVSRVGLLGLQQCDFC